jgi:PAS domain S-box-containing protein
MKDQSKTKQSLIQELASLREKITELEKSESERKQAEEALKKSEEQYRLLADNITEHVWLMDLNTKRTIYVSPSVEKMYGYTSDEILKLSLKKFLTAESLQKILDLFSTEMPKALANSLYNPKYSLELDAFHKDGHLLWIENTLSIIRDENSKPAFILGETRDITKRKQAEEALKESENKYRLLADNVSDVIFVLDMNLNYIYISPSVKILRGYEPEEVMKQPSSKALTPSSWDLVTKTIAEAMELEKEHREINISRTLQLEMMRKDGTTVWTEVNISVIRDENQQPVGILGVTRDITERKRAEDAVRQSEKYFKEITENSSDIIIITDKNGKIKYCSHSTEHFTGYKSEELIGRIMIKFIHPDDVKRVASDYGKAILFMDSAIPNSFRIVRKDGAERYWEGLGRNLLDNPAVAGFIMNIRDITERKQMEDMISQSEERYRTILDEMENGYFEVDQAGNFTFINDADCILLGSSREELLGTSFKDHINKEDIETVYSAFAKIYSTGKPERGINYRGIWKDGTTRFAEISGFPLKNKKGETIGFRGIALDVTERKRDEAKLQQTLESLRKAVGATIQTMVSAVEMRDPYTAGHQTRTADLARAIATEMGLTQEKIDGIRMAGSIHDIGKLSIPAEILSKPTKLTDIEFSLIKEHSQRGYEMLKNVESLWPLAQIVYQHHERMNGSGYPRNLKGDEILIEARIMAVADVVEAMASHRPYRPGLGIDAALAEIEKNKGTHYDNTVADACLRLFREKGYQLT